MAQKAKLFHDAKSYTAILKAHTPEECKELGRNVTPFDSAVWEKARYEALLTGVRAKSAQNEELRHALLSTGDSIIAQASPYDGIFGIKLSADAAAATEPNKWPGRNLLEKTLMEVRAELRG